MVQSASDLANDPQLKARGFFIELDHPELGKTISDANPIKLSQTPPRYKRAAPLSGQDNRYVYQQLLGISEEEMTELKQTFSNNNKIEMEHELGDVLFSLVNIARFIKVNPEEAMRKAIGRFMERFKYIEVEATRRGLDLKDLSLQEMDKYWNEAKKIYKCR